MDISPHDVGELVGVQIHEDQQRVAAEVLSALTQRFDDKADVLAALLYTLALALGEAEQLDTIRYNIKAINRGLTFLLTPSELSNIYLH